MRIDWHFKNFIFSIFSAVSYFHFLNPPPPFHLLPIFKEYRTHNNRVWYIVWSRRDCTYKELSLSLFIWWPFICLHVWERCYKKPSFQYGAIVCVFWARYLVFIVLFHWLLTRFFSVKYISQSKVQIFSLMAIALLLKVCEYLTNRGLSKTAVTFFSETEL